MPGWLPHAVASVAMRFERTGTAETPCAEAGTSNPVTSAYWTNRRSLAPIWALSTRQVFEKWRGPVLDLDPCRLYAYGGFDIAVTPWFSPLMAAWVERGGLLAVANLRGGGEYGRAWHEAGRRANKQNVFDDFCACAVWLATSGWSRRDRIAIMGSSNGGLLAGACLTQHPELFGACIPHVGVFDMLRFHKFTIGWAWTGEVGSPDKGLPARKRRPRLRRPRSSRARRGGSDHRL